MRKVEAVEALDTLQGRDLALVCADVPGQQIRYERSHRHRRSEARIDDTVEIGVADSGEVLVGGLVYRRCGLAKQVDVERNIPVLLHAPLRHVEADLLRPAAGVIDGLPAPGGAVEEPVFAA